MDTAKKIWEKPQLIVLGRGRPEEAVLEACKQKISIIGPGQPTDCFQAACHGVGQS